MCESCGLADDGCDYGSRSLGGVKGLAAGVRWLVPFRCCAPFLWFGVEWAREAEPTTERYGG